ncbi:MAG: hypothetical protein K2G64_04405 [Muribaculaceae bacterium]|nr:hypothetical protein [Muribaculaceae bacterium]
MKKIMKAVSAAFAAAVVMTSCGGGNGEIASVKDSEEKDATRDSLEQMLADQDSVLVLMNELSDAMNSIKQMEGIISQEGGSETTNRRQQLRNDMAAIQLSIEQNRQKLAQLEARLAHSNSNNQNLKRAIVSLKSQLADQQSIIASLKNDLASANIYIDELTQTKDSLITTNETITRERDETIATNYELNNQLNLVYYVIGSKKELKNHKIIETGFMRKSKISPSDYEIDYFTAADKRSLTTLPLHSKKAKVMSEQPTDTYEITTDASGMKVLNITNPDRFWATTNYLVVKID